MNILIDRPPETVEIDGREYPVNSDFRTCLKIILAFEDGELTPYEKQFILLENLYDEIPEDKLKAMETGLRFLNGGDGDNETSSPRVYSFEKDAGYIFAAFRQTHGIDLETAELHWYKFLALFMDLGANTTFCELVNLRKRVKTGKASKEERAAAREMGKVFELEETDTRTLDEKLAERRFLELTRGNNGG